MSVPHPGGWFHLTHTHTQAHAHTSPSLTEKPRGYLVSGLNILNSVTGGQCATSIFTTSSCLARCSGRGRGVEGCEVEAMGGCSGLCCLPGHATSSS